MLGNHDLHLLRVAHGTRRLGPLDTLDEILGATDRDELLEWLALQPFARQVGDWTQIHAGLHPTWRDPVRQLAGRPPLPLHADTDFATRVRYCSPSGERPRTDAPPPALPFAPWFEQLPADSKLQVVFGHWAALGRVTRPGLRGLDTGCVWGGRLTAWIAEDDRFVDVAAERTYCEPSSGPAPHSNE